MSIAIETLPVSKPRAVPFRQILPALLRDPFDALHAASGKAGGKVVRLNLGLFRPYLITHPDHVQHVLKTDPNNFVREGMFWDPLRRLVGRGILASGPSWERSRKTLNPAFTAKYVDSLVGLMAETVNEAVDGLEQYAGSGATVDAIDEMARIVNQTVIRLFFGAKVSDVALSKLMPAFDTAVTSMTARMLLPWVPKAVRLPGDRGFMRSTRTVDDVVYPLVREHREQVHTGRDVISTLHGARTAEGLPFSEQEVRDDFVSMIGASTESTSMALTWLWPVLNAHPQVATRLYAEIDSVIGRGNPVEPGHLPGLVYTRMVFQELLRLYPTGWLFPRTAVEPVVLGGVRVNAGGTLLISPFLTHRMPEFWDRPLDFDPERFAEGAAKPRHRYAYFPFGGGQHQCLGMHAVNIEAQLIIASVLSRFRPTLRNTEPITPQVAAALRPKQRVEFTLEHA